MTYILLLEKSTRCSVMLVKNCASIIDAKHLINYQQIFDMFFCIERILSKALTNTKVGHYLII